ncbi:MAG: BMP family lipoprotein [Paraclostridium sp.]
MKFKKLISLSLVTVMVGSTLVGCSSKDTSGSDSDNAIKVTMIADVGGINDQSFNQSAWEGLQKAGEDFGVKVNVLESKQAAEYETNVETAIDEGADLVIGIGFQMDKAIGDAAKNYPDQKLAIIDYAFENQPENVKSMMFKAEEASYLAGLIVGKRTETNKVGFIGGTKGSVIESFEYGYKTGVFDANKDAEVLAQYASTFSDSAKGKSIANQMHAGKADIIFTAAGETGNGAIEAAKENKKYAIGVDKDQSHLAPENILTSAIKRVDSVVYNTVKELVDGKFAGGEVIYYGLKEDAVGIPESTSKLVDEEILEFVNTQSEKIKNGEIKVPANEKEYNEYTK